MQDVLVSIILPCRNEEAAIGQCIQNIQKVIDNHNIRGEIIVSDSSKDKSADIAKSMGVTVAEHNKKGYGAALQEGFKHARGKYIFFADADMSYDFSEIPVFIKSLSKGNDLIIGNRFKQPLTGMQMPFLRRYLGNPLLTFLISFLYGIHVHDTQCGMRALRYKTLERLQLKTQGMEFASEMLIKAAKNSLCIKELPIDYYARQGKSKMRPFRDGFRHAIFIFLQRIYSTS